MSASFQNPPAPFLAVSAAVRYAVILLIAIPVSIWLGLSIGDESLPIPLIIGCGVLAAGYHFVSVKKIRLEAFLIALMIVGYILGNRGFANLAIISGTPTYVGEISMALCGLTLLVRIPFTKERLFPQDSLSPVILLFLLMGTVHVFFEYKVYEMLALRDFAIVYYSFMFVIAYRVGTDERSCRVINRALAFSLVVLIPLFPAVMVFFPDFFDSLQVRGLPVILYKDDQVTNYYLIGAIFFYLRWQFGRPKSFLAMFLALASLGMMFYTGKRAGYVGFGLALFLMVMAYRTRVLVHLTMAVAACVLLYAPLVALSEDRFQDSRAYALIVGIETIFDINGSGRYDLDSAEASAQNNRFRTFWWKTVAQETYEKSPIFGLGFGYDLAERFLRTYEMPIGTDFDARSPHSYFFTVLGRMGLLGVLSLLSILSVIAVRAMRVASMVHRNLLPPEALAYWLYAVAILGSAFFGVVLEGPMSGILFWSFLGMAAGAEARLSGKLDAKTEEAAPNPGVPVEMGWLPIPEARGGGPARVPMAARAALEKHA